MSPLNLLGIAAGLAMDATAVAVATSIMLGRVSSRQIFRFAFHFGLFQAVMPTLGWLGGRTVSSYIEGWDHWVAFALLASVGAKAIHGAFHSPPDGDTPADPTRGLSLVTLSVATSIDALAVGLSFAMLHVSIAGPVIIIGLVTAGLTTLGMLLGARIGSRLGKYMEVAGGALLIAIGLRILLSHLTAGPSA